MRQNALLLCVIGLVASFIVGCGGAKTSANVEDIYQSSVDAMAKANSYSFQMEVDQTLDIPDEQEMHTVESNLVMNGKMVENPLAMEMVISMNMNDSLMEELDEFENLDLKYFIKDQVVYMQNPMFGDLWVKEAMTELADFGFAFEPSALSTYFGHGLKQAKVTEEDRYYVLSIDGTNEQVKKSMEMLLDAIINNSAVSSLAEEGAVKTEDFLIEKLSFTIWIDKQTRYQEKIEMDLGLSVTAEGQTLKIQQIMNASFHDFAKHKEILIPAEVVEKAIDIETLWDQSMELYDLDGLIQEP
ncbi:hypothetical protein BHU72_12850 [Desulfuribacillus stibiiarsenatis]|uniref:Copper amine oxidase-like N-terminal domain-containing protein n=1 Tax=Desulfuribacillus stibiiarsenatis TaxID=1390249 RepID=A0A1E5L8L4_9FIRM|nr:DUF6612 family protein [Desulfuribacillus stibiiarsenatis]OEH86497.1 hypothetical protein BHU72_12850 [Desulfuribacillus stibiiarsenatis]